ncbi:MAG: glutathione S-transferase family protein [Legionellales bacterium]|nr:glutathione S-transferase family protein [Legionellales bacterium]
MLKLYQFSPYWGLPNASAFCLKLETYLRMSGIPYQVVSVNDPRKAPKGKLPYIRDGEQVIGDSSLIIDYLKKQYGDPLDASLSIDQQMQSVLIQRLVEDHLYWVVVYARWLDPINWPITRDTFFSQAKRLIKWILPPIIKSRIAKDLWAQGFARHRQTEIYQLGIDDLTVLAHLLQNQAYAIDEMPHSIDAVVYGFLANILYSPHQGELFDFARNQACFQQYCQRMQQQFYSDMPLSITTNAAAIE